MTSIAPPRWAEGLLRLLLPPADRASISGDLLEEYRESIVPSRGTAAATRWYIRQVAWYLWRSSAPWGLLAGAALVARHLVDFFVPVSTAADFRPRSAALAWTLIAIYVLAPTVQSWRTRSIRAGIILSTAAATIAGLLSIAGAGIMLGLWHDEASLALWRNSGGLAEIWVVPLIILCGAVFLSLIGSTVGRLLSIPFTRAAS